MLVGSYIYDVHHYNVEAYDFETSISIFLTPVLTEDKLFLDSGIQIGEEVDFPVWEKLFVSVGSGNVSTDCFTEQDSETGEIYKSRVNMAPITRLGEILRGMK